VPTTCSLILWHSNVQGSLSIHTQKLYLGKTEATAIWYIPDAEKGNGKATYRPRWTVFANNIHRECSSV
jgi:hypothetical protein